MIPLSIEEPKNEGVLHQQTLAEYLVWKLCRTLRKAIEIDADAMQRAMCLLLEGNDP